METFSSNVEAHYYTADLLEHILERLADIKGDTSDINRKDLSAVDEFHVRGAAISKELAKKAQLKNVQVLDVGCGIGGPARMLADECNCSVTGIDLSEEFIRTAQHLSKLVGLQEQTTFIQANATSLPFNASSFDAVWTQHVQMNIEDKTAFYGEINRVLKKNGSFIYYDIFKKGETPITFPVPWASSAEISFLSAPTVMQSLLKGYQFKEIETLDETENGIAFFTKLLDKINTQGPPKLGLNVLMGPSTKTKITNLLNGLKDGNIMLQAGIYTKT